MQFLPQDYESPKSNSGYMKIQDGENRIRILCAPIIGWEDWKEKKPIRYRMNNKPDKPNDPNKPIKHFWAFIVWDYTQQKVCIFEVTQASIRKRIEALSKDSDWGAPFTYDIKILRSGQAVDTEYTVNPVSHKEIDPRIKEAFYELPIELDLLYSSGDPYKGNTRTKGFWEEVSAHDAPAPVTEELVTREQANYLDMLIFQGISAADPNWRGNALKAMKIENFQQLEKRLYDLMMKRIEDKKIKIAEEDIPF